MGLEKYEVPAEKLRWHCVPALFKFECTKELSPLREFIGQDRAIRAVEFGLDMENHGYNIYVAGLSGTGKTSVVKKHIERIIQERKSTRLDDWCYLFNFKEPDHPQIINLPQGKGKVFHSQLNQLLNRLREGLGKAFASDKYKTQRQKMVEEGQKEQQKVLEEIANEARERGFFFQMTQAGPVIIPLVENRPMEEKEYVALDAKTRKEIESKQIELRKKLRVSLEKASTVEAQIAEKLREVDKEIGEFTVSRLFDPLVKEYKKSPRVVTFLNDLKGYTLDNLDQFKTPEEPINPMFGIPMSQAMAGKDPFVPFQVNVFVDKSDAKGPPVIIESNPTFGNMFGKIERRFLLGGYLTDHTMLKPGAVSLANGGFLILSAQDVLMNTGVWQVLKRVIKNNEVRIEDPLEQFGFVAPQAMRPEPMPVKVKIILIGDAYIYQMLASYDEDFWEIFRVKADFDFEIDRTKKNIMDYAAVIATCCDECKTRHCNPAAVSRLIEYAARVVSDQDKLSSRFARIKELVEEADYWAARDKSKYMTDKHVQKAIDEKIYRHNLIEEHIRDMIRRGTIMIDVDGSEVGQLNGLSVHMLGDIAFGRPSRITAMTFMGRGGVINIERESQLSGKTHDKGVLILSGYLGWKYAQERPLTLSASLCFEQSYDGIDGTAPRPPNCIPYCPAWRISL
jgi:predicted ATP-dependent protease